MPVTRNSHNSAASYAPSPSPSRRERVARSTPAQRLQLIDIYKHNPRPDRNEMAEIAEQVGMTLQHTSQWFASHRCRSKKTSPSTTSTPSHATSALPNALQLSLSTSDAAAQQAQPTPDSVTPDRAHATATSASSSSSSSSHPHPDIMTQPVMLAIPQPKRPKPRTSAQQDAKLQKLFDVSPNATKHEKARIALELGLTESKVNSWFTYARATQLHPGHPYFNSEPTTALPSPALAEHMLPLPRRNAVSGSSHPTSSASAIVHGLVSARTTRRRAALCSSPPSADEDDNDPTFMPASSSPRRSQSRATTANGYISSDDAYGMERKYRTRPNAAQLHVLQQEFAINQRPSMDVRVRLAHELGMKASKVTDWFRNYRSALEKRERRGDVPSGSRSQLEDFGGDFDATKAVAGDLSQLSLRHVPTDRRPRHTTVYQHGQPIAMGRSGTHISAHHHRAEEIEDEDDPMDDSDLTPRPVHREESDFDTETESEMVLTPVVDGPQANPLIADLTRSPVVPNEHFDGKLATVSTDELLAAGILVGMHRGYTTRDLGDAHVLGATALAYLLERGCLATR